MIEETLCPECNGPMIPRTSKHGKFWGCKAFPKCRGTRNSMGEAKYEQDIDDRLPSERYRENDKRRW